MIAKEWLEDIKERFAKYEYDYNLNGEDVEWLIQQVERLEKENKRLRRELSIEKGCRYNESYVRLLEIENKRLCEALEFYADENNYFVDISKLELPEDIFYAEPPVVKERGIKARKALEGEE